jgi:8-oxo-dGTP pyrophosphatase MutT (NUDIX family)
VWFIFGTALPNEEHVDAAARELFEKISFTLTVDDLSMFNGADVRVPLHDGNYQLVYVFAPSVHVPYVTTSLCTPTQVDHVVISQSTLQLDGF